MIQGLGRALSRTQAGYSLLEVIVVVAILGVAATLSGPSISRMITGQQARQVVRGLVTEFGAIRADAFVRSESYDAAAIQARLSERAPSDWRVDVNDALSVTPSGYCTPGQLSVEAPNGRIWALQISQGDCLITRESAL